MNEYQITSYTDNEVRTYDTEYFTNRREAVARAKQILAESPMTNEVDMQVIYNHQESDSELADVYWTYTRNGVTKTI